MQRGRGITIVEVLAMLIIIVGAVTVVSCLAVPIF